MVIANKILTTQAYYNDLSTLMSKAAK